MLKSTIRLVRLVYKRTESNLDTEKYINNTSDRGLEGCNFEV